jgi:hypothetical protein
LPSTSLVLLNQQLAYRPSLPLLASRPWCRRQMLCMPCGLLSVGLRDCRLLPMAVCRRYRQFRENFIFVSDTTVAASITKTVIPVPVRLSSFRVCQAPSLLACVDLSHRVPALTYLWPTTGGFHLGVGWVSLLEPRTHQPTGKTSETVKERVCFYAPWKKCQLFRNEKQTLCFQSSAAHPQGGARRVVQRSVQRLPRKSRMDRLFAGSGDIASRMNAGESES